MKKIWNHLEEGILLITFPLMTIITIAGTAVRYFELGTLTWSEESARYLMIVAPPMEKSGWPPRTAAKNNAQPNPAVRSAQNKSARPKQVVR